MNRIEFGDCRDTMRRWAEDGVKAQMCVTSPPYFGLRSYMPDAVKLRGDINPEELESVLKERVNIYKKSDIPEHLQKYFEPAEIGLEQTPEEYIAAMVEVFRCVRDVLADDGTLWLNIGDSYARTGGTDRNVSETAKVGSTRNTLEQMSDRTSNAAAIGLKSKDLIGIPWMLARALRDPYYTGPVKDVCDQVWLAAMLDAEGSICGTEYQTGDRIKTNIYISITNTSVPVIEKCDRLFPQDIKHIYEKVNGNSARKCFRWDVERMDQKALFLRTVYPHLVAKRKQAIIGYTFIEMQRGLVSKKKGYLAEQHEQRSWLMQAISLLNSGQDVDIPDWCIEPPSLFEPGYYLRQDIIWCLSGGAWVYARTQKGDMPVMVKDLVRLDPATVKLWTGEKWTRVLGWGASNDTSHRIELVLRSGERIGCTGGHLWPTQRGNVAARDLKVGDVIQTCRLPEPADAKRPAYLTDGLLWLIGLYLAEGSRSGDTIQISLHGDEKPLAPLIDMAAEQVGATITYHDEGDALHVRMYGRVLNAVLDEYIGGKTAIDKHLTTKAWMLPDDALRMVAQGYLHGDGHEDGNRVRLGFCRNYALERDLRTLAARLGATLTLKPSDATYQGGTKPAFRGEWRWERSGHHNERDRGEVVEIRASRARQFWDIAVEDEPHLFALASGVLTHNCKPNPMPESVRDRCTKAHEYVFLLSKSERYFFDSEAMKEPAVGGATGAAASFKRSSSKREQTIPFQRHGTHRPERDYVAYNQTRNRRSVWTVATRPYKGGAHFATFPPALIEPCILAGSRPGDIVLDPFMGSGTTAAVALQYGRRYLGCELNPEYENLQQARITGVTPAPDLFVGDGSLIAPPAAE